MLHSLLLDNARRSMEEVISPTLHGLSLRDYGYSPAVQLVDASIMLFVCLRKLTRAPVAVIFHSF